MNVISLLVRSNFHFSVWLSIIGGIMVFKHTDWIILNPEELLGPVENNLIIMGGYISLNQLLFFFWLYLRDGRLPALLMGMLFFLIAGGSWFYADVNGIPLNEYFPLVCLYLGISHCLPFLVEYGSEEQDARS